MDKETVHANIYQYGPPCSEVDRDSAEVLMRYRRGIEKSRE